LFFIWCEGTLLAKIAVICAPLLVLTAIGLMAFAYGMCWVLNPAQTLVWTTVIGGIVFVSFGVWGIGILAASGREIERYGPGTYQRFQAGRRR
jgi:hypothetical protein